MEFFEAQRYRKHRSKRLYWLLALSILLHTLILSSIFGLFLALFWQTFSYWVFISAFTISLTVYLLSGFIEYQRNINGGRAVAKRVGAVRLFIDDSFNSSQTHFTSDNQITDAVYTGSLQAGYDIDDNQLPNDLSHRKVIFNPHNIAVKDAKDFPDVYRRYYEFAEQMAIASGLGLPALYVLPDEMGINGFVAGRRTNDTVMVLTQGAIEKLSDEGLYGIISHLYSSVLHGDAKFNMHLLIMIGGMQLLYDLANSRHNRQKPNGYRSLIKAINESSMLDPVNFKISDVVNNHARHIEAQTKGFQHRSQWVNYWRQEQKKPNGYYATFEYGRRDRPSALGLMLYTITGSGVFWSKLITQRFNREREFLADATSLQLTRSHAIIETLRTIDEDSLGSRLVYTPHVANIDHFLFASYGADIDEESWFSPHPSINKRMQIVNNEAYQAHARTMLNKKRIKEAKLKEIYEQRRKGTWQALKESMPLNTETTALVYKPIVDRVVDGRLQTQDFRKDIAEQTGKNKPLRPYQTSRHEGLPKGNIALSHFKTINLPQLISEHLFHPLGSLALIEAAMLCHQYDALIPARQFGLKQIWLGRGVCHNSNQTGLAKNELDTSNTTKADCTVDMMCHKLDNELLYSTAKLDRRMDSGLIELAAKRLSRHSLSINDVESLKQKVEDSHVAKHEATRQYRKQLKHRQTLLKYQQGLVKLIECTTDCGVEGELESNPLSAISSSPTSTGSSTSRPNLMNAGVIKPNATKNKLLLWQATHFYLVVTAINTALGEQPKSMENDNLIKRHLKRQQSFITFSSKTVSSKTMSTTMPSKAFSPLQLSKLQLLGLMLYQHYQTSSPIGSTQRQYQNSHQFRQELPIHLQRLARLMDISFDDDETTQKMLKLLVKSFETYDIIDALGSILHIKSCITQETRVNSNDHVRQLTSWLSTFYTAMLSDGQLTQEEYDVLTLLAKFWLGKRVLVE